MLDESISVVTFLWDDGFRNYLPEHVNKLAAMVHKHLDRPHRFICVTDEVEGFNDDVELFKLPKSARWSLDLYNPTSSKKGKLPSSYRRLWLFSKEAKILGDRILMIDVDCLIVNALDPVFDFEEDFVGWRPMSEETTKVKAKVPYKRIGGGTWLLRTGTNTHIWEKLSTRGIQKAKRQGWKGSDQAWLSYNLARDCAVFPNSIGIYHTQDGARHWEEIPEDARIIHFNGKINPWDEEAQSRPWVCKLLGIPYDARKWKHLKSQKKAVPKKLRINIILYWWDKWPSNDVGLGTLYIKNMLSALKRNMPKAVDYTPILYSDREVTVDGVESSPLLIPHNLRWNLKKMYMYSSDVALEYPSLCIDLDCVIVGDMSPIINELFNMHHKLLMTCAGAYRKRRIGGSLIGFKPSKQLNDLLWTPLMGSNRAFFERITKGSERFYYQRRLLPKHVGFWEKYIPDKVLSYKRDCNNGGLPKGASIVRFHGKPRPHEINDRWVKENWR